MLGKNLYALPVKENGRAFSYYCLITSIDTPTCSWVLVRGGNVLSGGLCEDEDIETMLDALRSDLNGNAGWQTRAIH